jgi:hypothetical protein
MQLFTVNMRYEMHVMYTYLIQSDMAGRGRSEKNLKGPEINCTEIGHMPVCAISSARFCFFFQEPHRRRFQSLLGLELVERENDKSVRPQEW